MLEEHVCGMCTTKQMHLRMACVDDTIILPALYSAVR